MKDIVTSRNINLIKRYSQVVHGKFVTNAWNGNGEIELAKAKSRFKLDQFLELESDFHEVMFIANYDERLHINGSIRSHQKSFDSNPKSMSSYSSGAIDNVTQNGFNSQKQTVYRSYYEYGGTRLFIDHFGRSPLKILINQNELILKEKEGFLILESVSKIDFDLYSEMCYAILVAIGFISGDFIQDFVWVFQEDDNLLDAFFYSSLRPGKQSIFHAILKNPFGYSHLTGHEFAAKLYREDTLTYCDPKTLGSLAELILNNYQIKYALVLFNETISNENSLLIKNNGLYVVAEVLRKFFYEYFKEKLPSNYSSMGNIEKYRKVFEEIAKLSEFELEVLKRRNDFLHGNIKDFDGKSMNNIFFGQLTLIYKLVLSFIGYKGYMIDHYALRNNDPDNAFLKCN